MGDDGTPVLSASQFAEKLKFRIKAFDIESPSPPQSGAEFLSDVPTVSQLMASYDRKPTISETHATLSNTHNAEPLAVVAVTDRNKKQKKFYFVLIIVASIFVVLCTLAIVLYAVHLQKKKKHSQKVPVTPQMPPPAPLVVEVPVYQPQPSLPSTLNLPDLPTPVHVQSDPPPNVAPLPPLRLPVLSTRTLERAKEDLSLSLPSSSLASYGSDTGIMPGQPESSLPAEEQQMDVLARPANAPSLSSSGSFMRRKRVQPDVGPNDDTLIPRMSVDSREHSAASKRSEARRARAFENEQSTDARVDNLV